MSIDLMRDKPTVGVPIGQGTNGSGAQLQPVNPAYNTYVGARYVPIFAGEWDATKTYEPLTIVMWQGNSYTSKTFVPAQTEISNEDFWALTGNYNAQVEVYRQEVNDLKNKLNITYALQKRKFVFIGDSYSDSETPVSIAYQCKQTMNLPDDRYYNFSKGGAAFLGTSKTYQAQIEEAAMTIDNKETISDIVIIGGHNETGTVNEINSAMITFYNYATQVFPNTKIWIVMAGANAANSSKRTQLITTLQAYFASIKAFAPLYTGWHLYTSDSFLLEDKFHPSALGAIWQAKIICSALMGGETQIYSASTIKFVGAENMQASGLIQAIYNNDTVDIIFTPLNVTGTISANKWTKVAEVTSNIGVGLSFNNEQPHSGSIVLLPCTYIKNGVNNQGICSVAFVNASIYVLLRMGASADSISIQGNSIMKFRYLC